MARRTPRQQIGRAIAMIHRDPTRNWTVASLANTVWMSRSAFAAGFTQLVSEPAMRYAVRWKMQAALTRLKETGLSLAELASRLGYDSEAAFSRAFKRVLGVSPGAARRNVASASDGRVRQQKRTAGERIRRCEPQPMNSRANLSSAAFIPSLVPAAISEPVLILTIQDDCV